MSGTLDKVIGLTILGLILFYMFRDTSGTVGLLNGFSDLYTNSLKTLQGR